MNGIGSLICMLLAQHKPVSSLPSRLPPAPLPRLLHPYPNSPWTVCTGSIARSGRNPHGSARVGARPIRGQEAAHQHPHPKHQEWNTSHLAPGHRALHGQLAV